MNNEQLQVGFDNYAITPNHCPKNFEYEARLKNGNPLPDFVEFDPDTRTFKIYTTDGQNIGDYDIDVIVTNDVQFEY